MRLMHFMLQTFVLCQGKQGRCRPMALKANDKPMGKRKKKTFASAVSCCSKLMDVDRPGGDRLLGPRETWSLLEFQPLIPRSAPLAAWETPPSCLFVHDKRGRSGF
ncbi:hypothetical protein F4775DRAFT_563592, partial [Biscogniauxia sp. FL1348]